MRNSVECIWDDKMATVKLDDLESKITALSAVEALSDRNDVKTAADVLSIIEQYKSVLVISLAAIKGDIDAK